MTSVKDESISSAMAYLGEQSVLVRTGGYWNCLVAARKLASLFLEAGRRPWIARFRKILVNGDEVFHAPLIPRAVGIAATWTSHYVVCCDGVAYDPVAGEPTRLETHSLNVFGEEIAFEVFIPANEVEGYLAENDLR